MKTIEINLPGESYSIHIEPGLLARLGELVNAAAPHKRCLLVVDDTITSSHGLIAMQSLEQAGYAVVLSELHASEKGKTLATVERLYQTMLAEKFDRHSPIIALGGGITGDVAGFVAATYLRGVPFVQVPTTLLAMVDASIGGKTGVNHPLPNVAQRSDSGGGDSLGKNLIGAFWQPKVVIIDPWTLTTLEPRDFRCGLAECIKHGMIAEAGLLDFLETNAEGIRDLDQAVLTELIERSAAVKARIVAEDEREAGKRALLNLGHTFAHALESHAAYDLRHGEAVGAGLALAMDLSVQTGRMKSDERSKVNSLLEKFLLPAATIRPETIDSLMEAMAFDKKVANDRIRLVLPKGLGQAEIVEDIEPATIRACWEGKL